MAGINTPNRLEKTAGCLAGLALGDALGNATEFLTPEQIAFRYVWVDRLLPPGPDHPRAGCPAGTVTDDTGQALAVLETYLQERQFTSAAFVPHLLAWADRQGAALERMIGPSTRAALEKLRAGAGPLEAGAAGRTNGAAMRAAVVGLFHPGDFEGALRDAELCSLPTHGTNLAIAGAAAAACAVSTALVDGAALADVIEAGRLGAERGERLGRIQCGASLARRIELAVRLVEQSARPDEAMRKLYGVVGTDLTTAESVASAFGIVRLSEGDPQKAVVYGANIGGDTDTIAAIAGAVCGAISGISTFDPHMVAEVEAVNRIDFLRLAAAVERQRTTPDQDR